MCQSELLLYCRGVWMSVLLLWCAACIILPIIQGEGVVAVFFPYLIRRPQVRTTLHFDFLLIKSV